MRLIFIAISLAALVFLSGCVKTQTNAPTLSFLSHNLTLSVEIANTNEQINRGLMFRTSLGEREGMIFDMGRNSRQPFWMYHTLIPLDAIFMDEEMRVVDIVSMHPCGSEDAAKCIQYAPKNEMRYVLEVNGGAVSRWGIKEGDMAKLEK